MAETVIDKLYEDTHALLEYLAGQGEISFQSSVDDNFRKTLLLSIASYFEDKIKESIVNFTEESVGQDSLISHFLRRKAIERQYHTFFNWDSSNANQFFGLFGSDFKKFMDNEIKNDAQLSEAIRAFIELGRTRNQLVHQNFATFPLEKTAEEIYNLYKNALLFVESLPNKLRKFVHPQAD